MFDGVREFTSTQPGDSNEFMRKVQALVVGVPRDYVPARLYVIRVDNWFGPKWMHFAGKVSVGKHFYAGIHKVTLHVPPFVPHRVVAERVFAGPDYDAIHQPRRRRSNNRYAVGFCPAFEIPHKAAHQLLREERSHRSPYCGWIVRIAGRVEDEHSAYPSGLGSPNDCAQVSGRLNRFNREPK